jgi:hypothetical protein
MRRELDSPFLWRVYTTCLCDLSRAVNLPLAAEEIASFSFGGDSVVTFFWIPIMTVFEAPGLVTEKQ